MAPPDADLTRELAKNSFRYFCKLIMRQKFGDMHEEWAELVRTSGKKHISFMSARGHFKTTIMSVCYPLWRMYRSEKPIRVVALSGTLKQSSEIMTLVKEKIETNPLLEEILMPENIHSTKWSETEIKCKNGCRMMCVPFGDAVRGFHPHLAILDDVLKVDEATDIEGAKDTFWGTVFPIINANKGKLVVLGTPVAYTDLLHDLQKNDLFVTKTYPAVILKDSGEWDRAQFPEHYPLEDLRVIKDAMPSGKWAREYMCQPLSSETSVFPQQVIKKSVELHVQLTPLYTFKAPVDERGAPMLDPRTNEPLQAPRPRRVMGCDIAVSATKRSDWSVFIVLDMLPQMPIYVRDIIRKHITTDENIREIEHLQKIYQMNRILVEKTGVGAGVAQMLARQSPIHGVITEFDTKQKSREQILGNLEVAIRNGTLAIPDNEVLRAELGQFAYKRDKFGKTSYESLGAHDDCVFALAIALEAAAVSIPCSIQSV